MNKNELIVKIGEIFDKYDPNHKLSMVITNKITNDIADLIIMNKNFSNRVKKCFSSEKPRSKYSIEYQNLKDFFKSKKFNKLDQQLVDLLMDWDINLSQVRVCANHLHEIFPKAEIIDDKYIKYIIDNKAVDKYSYDHGSNLQYNIQIDGLSEFIESGGKDAHKFEGYYIQAKDLDEATKIYNDVNLINFIKLSEEFWSGQK